MPDLTEKELAEFARKVTLVSADEWKVLRAIIAQAARVPGLLKQIAGLAASVGDHEEDSACLPEDRSVTETVTALRTHVAELEGVCGHPWTSSVHGTAETSNRT